MAKRNPPKNTENDVGPFRTYKPAERERGGAVQGEADLEYGMVSGFSSGFVATGNRFKAQLPYVREGCAHDRPHPDNYAPGRKAPKGNS